MRDIINRSLSVIIKHSSFFLTLEVLYAYQLQAKNILSMLRISQRPNIKLKTQSFCLQKSYFSCFIRENCNKYEKEKNDDNVLWMWRMHWREYKCILQQGVFLYLVWTIRIYNWVQSSADVTHWHKNIFRLKIVQNTVDKGNRYRK